MAMRLLSKTYWRGTWIRFRREVPDAIGTPLALDTADGARVRGIWWTSRRNPRPKVAVIAAHPRVDFSEHHAFPALLEAGYGCLGANLRTLNNDVDCLHEKLLVDLAAYLHRLRDLGVERVLLLGNSGGGALFSFYQWQAKTPRAQRLRTTPGGRPTGLDTLDMPPGDAIVYMAAHTGQGLILNEVIDASVLDERDPLRTDPELDLYDPRNGFVPPPAWTRYDRGFVARYRAAQLERVRRIDAIARSMIDDAAHAERLHADPGFAALPQPTQRRILEREAFEPVMLVYRTMANPNYVDDSLDPSPRGYGSLLSPRPDLMNLQRTGFARVVTPQGWLSTWSGLSSQANVFNAAAAITEPAVVIHAGRDLDVYPLAHSRAIFEAIASTDKDYWDFPDALHYFEPDDGESGSPSLDALTARLVPWVEARLPL
jgi:hypothetical protein